MSKPKIISVHTDEATVLALTNIARTFKMSRNDLINRRLKAFVAIFRYDHENIVAELKRIKKLNVKLKDENTKLRVQNAKLLMDKRNGTIRK